MYVYDFTPVPNPGGGDGKRRGHERALKMYIIRVVSLDNFIMNGSMAGRHLLESFAANSVCGASHFSAIVSALYCLRTRNAIV